MTAKKGIAYYRNIEKTCKVDDVPNLFVRVTKTANCFSRSFIYRIKRGGREYMFSIGSLQRVGLPEAKALALEITSRIVLEGDIDKVFKSLKTSRTPKLDTTDWTVEQMFVAWVEHESDKGRWKVSRQRTYGESITAMFNNHLSSRLRQTKAQDLETEDVVKEIRKIWTKYTSTPEKLLTALCNAYEWALRRKLINIPFNPADSKIVREHLSYNRPMSTHHPYLEPELMPEFMSELLSVNTISAKCLAFQILCALRSSNARLATWDQVDLKRKTFTIKREEMKSKFTNNPDHVVPLSDTAIEILTSLPRFMTPDGLNKYVFASWDSKSRYPVTEQSIYKTIKQLDAQRRKLRSVGWRDRSSINRNGRVRLVVPHGLARTSFETWALDGTTFKHSRYDALVIDYIMDHQLDKYRGAYKRRPPVGDMREVLDDWAKFCCSSMK